MGWIKRLSSSWAGVHAWSTMVSGTEREHGETPGERLDDARTEQQGSRRQRGEDVEGRWRVRLLSRVYFQMFLLKRASMSLQCFKHWGLRLDGFCQGIPSSVGGLVGANHGQRQRDKQSNRNQLE